MNRVSFYIFLEIIGILISYAGVRILSKKNGQESLFFPLLIIFIGVVLLGIPLFSGFIFGFDYLVCNNSC